MPIAVTDIINGTVVELFCVYKGESEHGGGTPGWYFDNERLAHEVARGRGWYGGKASVEQVRAIETAEGYYILADLVPVQLDDREFNQEVIRQRAKAKLTKEEREALGITND